MEPNQPGITRFVERGKDQPIQFISANKSAKQNTSELTAPSNNQSVESTNKKTNKRSRPVLSSPDSSTERRPNKRQVMENPDENPGGDPPVKLNPELEMLKRQLFADIESMIEPLKRTSSNYRRTKKSKEMNYVWKQ